MLGTDVEAFFCLNYKPTKETYDPENKSICKETTCRDFLDVNFCANPFILVLLRLNFVEFWFFNLNEIEAL